MVANETKDEHFALIREVPLPIDMAAMFDMVNKVDPENPGMLFDGVSTIPFAANMKAVRVAIYVRHRPMCRFDELTVWYRDTRTHQQIKVRSLATKSVNDLLAEGWWITTDAVARDYLSSKTSAPSS